jgi:hypothetical protein
MQILTFEHHPIIEMDRLAGIHRVTIFKQTGSNYLLARVVLMDDLFQYPFRFPDLFEGNLTKHERLVRIEFIKTFSSNMLIKPLISDNSLGPIKSLIKKSKKSNKFLLI